MNSMDLPSIWSFTQKKSSPLMEAFLEPMPLGESALIQKLTVVGKELIASFSAKTVQFQHNNFRYLIWKVEILVILFEYIYDMESCVLLATANLCFKELCLLFYQSKALLDYCFESSRIWILIQNQIISHQLHDICKEILMVLDIFPLQEINLCEDVGEQIEVLKRQLARKKVFTDPQDEAMRKRLLSFVEEFEAGRIPEYVELKTFFVDKLGIQDAKTFRSEMKFLGDLIRNHEDEVEPFSSLVKGIVAVTHYCRFLFFGFEEDEAENYFGQSKELQNDLVSQMTEETFSSIQKDLSCPISLELMQDPVIISTGQTYDRTSISEWLRKENLCPKTRQSLINTRLVPNRALRSLISKWCIACGIPSGFDPTETLFAVSPTRAVIEANKATGNLLIKLLSSESIDMNIFAAHELHLLAKSGKENRAYIAEAGTIPLFQKLLLSHHPVAQEKSVKAILFLSMHENNRILIMEQVAESIVHVLINGQTDEAREDAASTLSCLCAIHDYRARIAGIEGAVDALLRLLKRGGRAKITAVNTLVLMADHANNCSKLIEAGCLKYLAEALDDEELAEHAAAVFISLIRHPLGAEVIKDDHTSIIALLVLTRHDWSPRAMNNAIVALKELFPDLVVPVMIVGGLPAA